MNTPENDTISQIEIVESVLPIIELSVINPILDDKIGENFENFEQNDSYEIGLTESSLPTNPIITDGLVTSLLCSLNQIPIHIRKYIKLLMTNLNFINIFITKNDTYLRIVSLITTLLIGRMVNSKYLHLMRMHKNITLISFILCIIPGKYYILSPFLTFLGINIYDKYYIEKYEIST